MVSNVLEFPSPQNSFDELLWFCIHQLNFGTIKQTCGITRPLCILLNGFIQNEILAKRECAAAVTSIDECGFLLSSVELFNCIP